MMIEKKEYIEREALLEAINEVWERIYDRCTYQPTHDAYRMIIKRINRATAVDVKPVRYGEWIKYNTELFGSNYKCSECGNRALEDNCGCFSILTNYCYECGATMKRKDET